MGLPPLKNQHDRSYRRLFSNPRLIKELILGFIDDDWVERLDFTTLMPVPAIHVAENLRIREGDMVWRLQTSEGRTVYVYLLLEFQSTVDRFMAVRIMGYEAELYLDLIARGELTPDRGLPVVIPIVLFNGNGNWWAARDVAELVEPFSPEADPFRPRLRYRLIDEGSYDLQELAGRRNLVAVLFWLEKTPEPADLQRGVQRLVELLDGPEDGELRSAFASWLRLVRLPGLGLTEEDIPEVLGLEEFRAMLEERVKEWNKVLLERGRQEGEATVLLRLLEVKFGKVDSRTRARIRAAGPERLLRWAERLVTAEKLPDVFVR